MTKGTPLLEVILFAILLLVLSAVGTAAVDRSHVAAGNFAVSEVMTYQSSECKRPSRATSAPAGATLSLPWSNPTNSCQLGLCHEGVGRIYLVSSLGSAAQGILLGAGGNGTQCG